MLKLNLQKQMPIQEAGEEKKMAQSLMNKCAPVDFDCKLYIFRVKLRYNKIFNDYTSIYSNSVYSNVWRNCLLIETTVIAGGTLFLCKHHFV